MFCKRRKDSIATQLHIDSSQKTSKYTYSLSVAYRARSLLSIHLPCYMPSS